MYDLVPPPGGEKERKICKWTIYGCEKRSPCCVQGLSDCRQSPRLFAGDFSVLKRLKVSIFKTFQSLFGIIKVSKKAVLFYDDTRNRKSKKANADGMY